MDAITLNLEKRTLTGKAVKQLRDQGMVPAVIHDHGKESVHVMGDFVALTKAYRAAGKHHPVSLQADGHTYTALIKGVDIDPKKNQIRHVVFNAIKADEKVDAQIPVHMQFSEGNESTPAERASLVVLRQLETVDVEALLEHLPDALYFDGEKLVEVGDHATVADLIVPAGVTIKTDPTHPLATVFEPSALQAANDAAGGDAEADKPAEAESEPAADATKSEPAKE